MSDFSLKFGLKEENFSKGYNLNLELYFWNLDYICRIKEYWNMDSFGIWKCEFRKIDM